MGTSWPERASCATPAMATTINFDDVGAPCLFANQTPLTNQYSSLGVNFNGVGGNPMEVLNQCGNFGFNARSGENFLAYNLAAPTANSELLSFTLGTNINSVSIWGASNQSGTMQLLGYDALNNLIASSSAFNGSTSWQQLSLASNQVFDTVRLVTTLNYGGFDDLEFTTSVPEPGTLALLGLGFAGLGVLRLLKARPAV